MQVFTVALIFRYIEVIIDCVNLGLYYGSNTQFMLPSLPSECGYTTIATTTVSPAGKVTVLTSTPHALFSINVTKANECFNTYQPGDGFGEFVLIGGFILAVIILVLSIILEADKKYNLFVLGYNAVFFVFFFAAGIVILNTWSGNMYDNYISPYVSTTTTPPINGLFSSPSPLMDTFNSRRACALAVGSFCIIQCAVLIGGGFFIIKQKKDNN